MSALFDARQLDQLASAFRRLCGIPLSVRGADGKIVCGGGARPAPCALLRADPAGRERCAQCCELPDGEFPGVRFCRCRAGLQLALLPIRGGERGEPLAWLCAGPFLDEASDGERRAAIRRATDGCGADADALREALLKLRRLSNEDRTALAAMLEAMADSVRQRGLILPSREGDLRRLERFLDEHYTEKLSLASVSAQLHIGRTRLCALAKELSGGQTLFSMIARRRIDAAKELLLRTDRPVSAIAEAVGISDYNYFSKIFRAAAGVSPSKFRKQARSGLDDLV